MPLLMVMTTMMLLLMVVRWLQSALSRLRLALAEFAARPASVLRALHCNLHAMAMAMMRMGVYHRRNFASGAYLKSALPCYHHKHTPSTLAIILRFIVNFIL
jgi:hypothetical protein